MEGARGRAEGAVVRKATRADLPAVRDLLGITWHHTYDAIYGAERVTDITSRWHSVEALTAHLNHPNGCLLVAEVDSQIGGAVNARSNAQGTVDLMSLYVAPDCQGVGIGQALLDHMVAAFPDARVLRLEVEPANSGAIRFYERNGFRIIGSGDDCGGQGDGIVHRIMERRLG